MAAQITDATVLFRDDVLLIAAWSNLVITHLHGAIRREHQSEIARAYKTQYAAHPEGLVSLTFLAATVSIGEPEIRKEASRMLESFASMIRLTAIVLEGSGIWAGTMRTVLRGMTVLAKNPFGMKVFANEHEAVRALVPMIAAVAGKKPTERDVFDLVNGLRQGR